jgi:hypothetical protein
MIVLVLGVVDEDLDVAKGLGLLIGAAFGAHMRELKVLPLQLLKHIAMGMVVEIEGALRVAVLGRVIDGARFAGVMRVIRIIEVVRIIVIVVGRALRVGRDGLDEVWELDTRARLGDCRS